MRVNSLSCKGPYLLYLLSSHSLTHSSKKVCDSQLPTWKGASCSWAHLHCFLNATHPSFGSQLKLPFSFACLFGEIVLLLGSQKARDSFSQKLLLCKLDALLIHWGSIFFWCPLACLFSIVFCKYHITGQTHQTCA